MQYNDIYRGIVIQHNDPKQAGRVKVFVPEVNITLLKNWNQDKKNDKEITHLGDNTGTALTPEIQERLRLMLPWAEVMLPTFGMSTPAFFQANSNKSFVGNDGGLTSQDSNKTTEAFNKDKKEEASRKPYAPEPSAKAPRQTIDQTPVNTGQTFCVPISCGSSSSSSNKTTFPSIYLGYNKNSCLNRLIQTLPNSYSLCDTNIIPPSKDNPLSDFDTLNNTTITDIKLSVENPEIYINNKKIDVNSTIFGVKCYIPISDNTLQYNAPILFTPTTNSVIPKDYNNIPIKMNINGSDKITQDFYFSGNNGSQYEYVGGNFKIVLNANNIKNIELSTTGQPTQISKLNKILPLLMAGLSALNTLSNVIMPRGASTGKMISRGGPGSTLYNSVNSPLLPYKTRANSLIGGHNNVSKETQNAGRKNTSSYESNTKPNLQSPIDAGGPYRPSNNGNSFNGVVSIPAPGAHVFVRFEGGDSNKPIVIGTFAAQADYQQITNP